MTLVSCVIRPEVIVVEVEARAEAVTAEEEAEVAAEE